MEAPITLTTSLIIPSSRITTNNNYNNKNNNNNVLKVNKQWNTRYKKMCLTPSWWPAHVLSLALVQCYQRSTMYICNITLIQRRSETQHNLSRSKEPREKKLHGQLFRQTEQVAAMSSWQWLTNVYLKRRLRVWLWPSKHSPWMLVNECRQSKLTRLRMIHYAVCVDGKRRVFPTCSVNAPNLQTLNTNGWGC